MRRVAGSGAEFAREAGGVGREIGEGDGLDALGNDGVRRGEALQRIVESHGLVGDEFGEDVGGEDLGERAEAQQGVLGGKLMRVGCGLAVSAEEDLIVANDDQNHAGGSGLEEEVGAESADGLGVGERCWWLRLRKSRDEERAGIERLAGWTEVSRGSFLVAFLRVVVLRVQNRELICIG